MNDRFKYVNDNGGSVEFATKLGWIITSMSGFSENSVNVTTSTGIGQVGASVQTQAIQTRSVSITGILAGRYAECLDKKEKLLSVVLPGVKAKLYHNNEYYLEVVPTTTPVISADRVNAQFQFSLIAPYPYWLKDGKSESPLNGIEPKFKFPWKIKNTYQFGQVVDVTYVNVNNDGQLSIPFTAEFRSTGNVTNPKLTNIITNQWLRLNYSMVASEVITLEISHDLITITSTVNGDIRGTLDLDSTLLRLNVGDNLIKPSATTGGDAMKASIKFAIEKVGVAVC